MKHEITKHKNLTKTRSQLFRTFVIIIFVLSYIFVFSYETHAARLYFYPQNLSVSAGDSFIVEVRFDTEGESVNALEIEGTVENGVIESITTANSMIKIFIESLQIGENKFRFVGGRYLRCLRCCLLLYLL